MSQTATTTSKNDNLPAVIYSWNPTKRVEGQNIQDTAEYKENPKKAIKEYLGNFIKQIELAPAKVLVATFKRPEKTAGGILIPNSNRIEDIYQGSVGLVLKMGSMAFKDDAAISFGGFKPKVDDWVVYRPMNGIAKEFNGLHCRIIKDEFIDMIVPNPTEVW